MNRDPLWKSVGIIAVVAGAVLAAVALAVWIAVARDRVTAPTPTPTARPATVTPAPEAPTGTPEATAEVPAVTVRGVVEDYAPGALIIVLQPLDSDIQQVIVPDNIQVRWKDGSLAAANEIEPQQTIEAQGQVDALGRLIAHTITIVDPASPPTATPAPTATPEETPTPEVPVSGWLGEYYANVTLTGQPALARLDEAIDFDWGTEAPDAALPADRFSVRWRGLWPFDAGRYQFTALTDDGVRVWVNGQRVIDNWREQALAQSTGELYLEAGTYLVEVEYFDNREGAQAQLSWQAAGSFANWKGEYFANPELQGEPVLVRNDEKLELDWGAGSPGPQVPSDSFSARWTQSVAFSEGAYRFHVYADDGVRLWLDDRLIIDGWQSAGAESLVGYAALSSGNHAVRVEFVEHAGNASIQLWWEQITAFAGWRGEYYGNPDLADQPYFVRDDAQISADWGAGGPGSGVPGDAFSVRWTARLALEQGRYSFSTVADDGARVYVDGRVVIDAWMGAVAQRREGSIDLDAGEHRIVVEYYEAAGQASIQFDMALVAEPTVEPVPTKGKPDGPPKGTPAP
ncbi:MAG: PA14 domain-containing protein [Anaerolineae bacterium]|nr:hypothetical protein [Chloroflexota bacterium]